MRQLFLSPGSYGCGCHGYQHGCPDNKRDVSYSTRLSGDNLYITHVHTHTHLYTCLPRETQMATCTESLEMAYKHIRGKQQKKTREHISINKHTQCHVPMLYCRVATEEKSQTHLSTHMFSMQRKDKRAQVLHMCTHSHVHSNEQMSRPLCASF